MCSLNLRGWRGIGTWRGNYYGREKIAPQAKKNGVVTIIKNV